MRPLAAVRGVLTLMLALVVGTAGLVLAKPAGAASFPSPTGLAAVSRATTALSLRWSTVPGAVRYRVKYDSKPDWSSPKYALTSTPYAELGNLAAGTTFHVKVRVTARDGTNLGPYSSVLSDKTQPSDGFASLSPTGLTAKSPTSTSLALIWNSRGTGVHYRVLWSTSPSLANPSYRRFSGPGGTLTGLRAGTRYHLRVRATDATGLNLSEYSAPITASTLTSEGYRLLPPTGLILVSSARQALRVSWKGPEGAKSFGVKWADNSAMAKPSYLRTAAEDTEISGLRAGTTYYVKVRALDADGGAISAYGAKLAAATRETDGFPLLAPDDLASTDVTATTAALTWADRGKDVRYRVRYSRRDDFAEASFAEFETSKGAITSLLPNTSYWVAVRVISTANLSDYSSPLKLRTTTRAAPLRVANYNIKCAHYCYDGAPNESHWENRRDAVIATIKAQQPAVLALQEAAQSRVVTAYGNRLKVSQFEDLVGGLGPPYRLANPHRYNCVNSLTGSKCAYLDRGASRGIKIVYNSAEVQLLDNGSRKLPEATPSDSDRYVAWASFRQVDSGKDFMFANVHLAHTHDPSAAASATYDEARRKQTTAALAEVAKHNPRGLPVVFAGDFVATKWAVPSNGPYDLMVAAGYVDPLGNGHRSNSPTGATVEKRIRTEYNSFNRFLQPPPKSRNVNGSYTDYIFTLGRMRVSEWETVLNLDSKGSWVGVIPSDHNMLRATVWLP